MRTLTDEDLWRLARPTSLSLSPDGAQAVCAVTTYDMAANQGGASLWLLSTLGGAPRRLTQCGERDGEPVWSPDGRWIAFVAKREGAEAKDAAPQLHLIAPDGGEARRVTNLATGVAGIKWFPDSKRVAFISWVWPDEKGAKAQAKRLKALNDSKVKAHVVEHTTYRYWDHWLSDGRVPHLFTVSIESGKVHDLFEGTRLQLNLADPGKTSYDIAPAGDEIAFGFNPNPDPRLIDAESLVVLKLKSGKSRTLAPATSRSFASPSYSPDGRWLACIEQEVVANPMAPTDAVIVDRATGEKRRLAKRWDRSVNAPLVWADDSASLYTTAEDNARTHVVRVPLGGGNPDVVVRGGTVSDFAVAGDTVVATLSFVSTPQMIVTADLADTQSAPRRIERFNDAAFANIRLGRVEEITFPGWNNEPVHGWVFYPPNFDPKKKWPLLHVIHGGPHLPAADGIGYRWNNHVFAAQGYVVLHVNYHGSTSFGAAFTESIHGCRGMKEHADIEAATDFMLTRGFIDPDRLVATGGSYGGFMVAFMNGRNGAKRGGDRYKAYVCHAGILDWIGKFSDDAFLARAQQLGAFYWDDPDKIAEQNPVTHVKHMKTPTLVIHGLLDYRVPDAQGLMYYNTLKAKGVATRLVHFDNENHWILKPQNSRLWYREFFAWLARFAPGGGGKR
ncbi:MAG: S9 family peptidase [Betaproteobacteria bacterium]|nr:S9 family peptidase [Betaproteobacteria bacterium]